MMITLTDKITDLAATPDTPAASVNGIQQPQADMRMPAPSDTQLIQEHAAHRFIAAGNEVLFVSLPDGTIAPIQDRLSRVANGAIQLAILEARSHVSEDEYLLTDDYHALANAAAVSAIVHWANLALAQPERYGIRVVRKSDIGRAPVVPLRDGGALDLRTGEIVGPTEVLDALVPARTDGDGRGVAYDPDLLAEPPDAAWEILDHYGHEVLCRIARHIALGAMKDLDVMKAADPDFGKSTLTELLKFALPGLVDFVDGRQGLSATSERFSMVRRMLTTGKVLFVDEADKVSKQSDSGLLNSLTSTSLPVELKGVDGVMLPRTAVPVMIGNDWPDLQAGIGADARVNWGYEWASGKTLDKATRAGWFAQEALDWLSTYVLTAAISILEHGDDTGTPEARATAAMALDSMVPDEERAIKDVFAVGGSLDFLPTAAMKEALTDAGYDAKAVLGAGKKTAARIQKFSPKAKSSRQTVDGKQVSGYTHIKLQEVSNV